MRSDIFEQIITDEDFDVLNNLIRWNDSKRNKDETVAHHTFLVIWFTRILVENIFDDKYYQIKLDITTLALFHDFDEAFTGDILHPFKYNEYNGEQVRKAIDDYCEHRVSAKYGGDSATDKLFREHMTPKGFPPYYKKIVKVADWLSMVFYVRKEIKLGITEMKKKYYVCIKKMRLAIEFCMDELKEQQFPVKADLAILIDTKNSNFEI